MDPTKPSHVNNSGGNESLTEEAVMPWLDSLDRERQRDTDTREPDVDGTSASAETNTHHKGSSDKQRFGTLGYQRQTKQKVVTAFPTVTKGTFVGVKPRGTLRQVLFSQGVSEKNLGSEERGQLDVLKQDLGNYGVPVSLKWRWKEESQGTTLEKNWTDIVDSHLTMSTMQRHQQEALWELIHTELTYINKLIVIKDLVIAALVNLHQRGFLLEVTPELLFSNLPSILSAHQLFWQDVIYPMLDQVRRTGMPFDPMMLETGCLQFHQRFYSYQHYCWEEEYNLGFTGMQMESNPHFVIFVQWVETHPQCERMRLGDMQAKPHQRITKYPLLLKAILKATQDPYVQQSLRNMLSNVKSFLENINDYLRLKDEELALIISAQRVEGYEVEGINEEIDKHVREICHFDLTCPIRGVGAESVRKLLLEENLKIRGRKDNKLEVVALLFSDVLLMTQVQKKGERLKVIRPPLALDRTYCMALKDGCSFVLIEVGELQSAMNVYIFAAITSESCSTWVSTIQQAKETLRSWREKESLRRMEKLKIQRLGAKPVAETKTEDMFTEEKPLNQSGGDIFVAELDNELIIPKSVNGILAPREADERYQPPDVTTYKPFVSFYHSQSNKNSFKLVLKAQQREVKGYEWIEMGVRRQEVGIHPEERDKMVESVMTNKQMVSWDNTVQSTTNLDQFPHNTADDPLRYNKTRPHFLLIDEYPEIDYPTNEDSIPQPTYQTTVSRQGTEFVPGEEGMSTERDSLWNQDMRKSYSYSQPADMDAFPEAWSFPKNLKSPGLQRRRLANTHHRPSSQTFSQGSELTCSASFSNSDLDNNSDINKMSVPFGPLSRSHQVLKLGSLKPKQEMIWNINGVSPDPQTVTEPELSDLNFCDKTLEVKTQRSASTPYIRAEGSPGPRLHSSSLYTISQAKEIQLPSLQHDPNGHSSPLEGLLERATARVRDRDRVKTGKNMKRANLRSRNPPLSPSLSTAPSLSHNDGDRDTDWEEEEVKLMRHRALTVSKGWKEQLVDGDDDGEEKRDSVVYMEGVNVDWPGWCFDDDEVMDHLHPEGEGLLEGISRSLAFWDLEGPSEQDYGECSQV